MLVGTESGDTYTAFEIQEWMAQAGLVRIATWDTPFGTSMIVGRRPADAPSGVAPERDDACRGRD
jgi:hypothetical protein